MQRWWELDLLSLLILRGKRIVGRESHQVDSLCGQSLWQRVQVHVVGVRVGMVQRREVVMHVLR